MHSLRIRGVVKLADAVRREISRPISDAQKQELRRLVSESTRKIVCILAEYDAKIEVLPHQTRRAYEYLSGVDFDSVATVASGYADSHVCRGMSFAGLPTHRERILDTMARPVPPGQVDTLHAAVRVTSRVTSSHPTHSWRIPSGSKSREAPRLPCDREIGSRWVDVSVAEPDGVSQPCRRRFESSEKTDAKRKTSEQAA